MKYFARALNLKDDPELIAKYKKYHCEVWPEVLSTLRNSGITRMKIFLEGRRLFMYCEARDDYDPVRASVICEQSLKNKEWQELMQQFQEPLPGAPAGEWGSNQWFPMEEVFDLEKT